MQRLCSLNEIPERESIGFELGDYSLFAVRRDGEIYLYWNSCPHLGIELNWSANTFLDIEEHYIQCATHGALFQVEDGLCVAGPCRGQRLDPVDYEIREASIWVALPRGGTESPS